MSRYLKLQVTDIQTETPDTVSVAFHVPDEFRETFRFQAGQHLNVRAVINGEEVRRSYSICSTPTSGELRVAIKKVAGGKFSTYANDVLKPGDNMEVMPPDGHFVLRQDDADNGVYVFFAAGSGITPVLSLVETILRTKPEADVILFYGNKNTESIIFREKLDGLKNTFLGRFELHHLLSQEKQSAPLMNGRIDAEKCKVFAKTFFQLSDVARFFICGPELMNFALRDCLVDMGIPEKHIAVELFVTPGEDVRGPVKTVTEELTDPQKECLVKVRLDGDTTEFNLAYGGQSILDAASAAGIDVPFSCKGGVCCTCKAKLVDGEVEMDVVYGLEPDEIENNFILTCQAHPRSEQVFVDYDIR